MPPNEAGARALRHLDAALARKPEKDGQELSAALRCLGAFRDDLVRVRREAGSPQDDTRLDHVNAVISSVMAVQYPLGELQWPELEKARGWLAGVLDPA